MSLARWTSAARDLFHLHSAISPLWGDGFENDSFRDFASVKTWDEVSNDEFLRLYPRLLNQTHPRLLTHVERCVATLRTLSGASGAASLRSIGTDQVRSLASEHAKVWSPSPTRAYLRGLARGEVRALDDVLLRLRAGDAPAYEPSLAELFAFHTAVHPAYFWGEAVATHQRLTTFAWLGVVMRGRSALMPFDVAEYLLESAADQAGDLRLTDRLGTPRTAAQYLRQARRRIEGREVITSREVRGPWREGLAWSAR